jgi:hypothetical protein
VPSQFVKEKKSIAVCFEPTWFVNGLLLYPDRYIEGHHRRKQRRHPADFGSRVRKRNTSAFRCIIALSMHDCAMWARRSAYNLQLRATTKKEFRVAANAI